MLKNYLKIAWKVLLRRKFFTFISLFGISFTLMILTVGAAMLDHLTGPVAPETRLDRTLFINLVQMTGQNGTSRMNTPPSYYYLNHFVGKMQTPEKMSFTSVFKGVNSYVHNKRLSLDLKFTDADFWEVLEFKFLEGKPFTRQDMKNGNYVTVISAYTRDQYFGKEAEAVGKYLVADGVKYRVSGVVENVPISRYNSYADLWVPLSTAHINKADTELNGDYMAILQARSAAGVPAMKAEYQKLVSGIKPPNPREFDTFSSHADTILEGIARQLFGNGENSNLGMFFAFLSLLIFLFMLMPTINLVNINVSRILERSSEIGVRKAFGASSRTLVGQFLVENIFLTLLGGLLGFLLSVVALQMISSSGVIPHAQLGLNFRVFGIGLGLSLIFGLVSGVYPAFKMSKLVAVEALKGGQK